MSNRETSGQPGDWLVETVRRNPEALLVLAAGCALLMRSKGARNEGPPREARYPRESEQAGYREARASGSMARAADSAQQYASDVTSRVSDAASGATREVTDAASRYASSISAYASDVRDAVSSGVSQFPDQARSTVQQGFARILREQPLAVAAMGLAAGATMAAIFPATESESKVLGPAHDAMLDAASRTAESVKAAAGAAGEHLKQAARERGLDPDGLKDLAREVAGNFADNVAGRPTNQNQSDAPGLVPENTGGGTRP
jgi:hypothetical protein